MFLSRNNVPKIPLSRNVSLFSYTHMFCWWQFSFRRLRYFAGFSYSRPRSNSVYLPDGFYYVNRLRLCCAEMWKFDPSFHFRVFIPSKRDDRFPPLFAVAGGNHGWADFALNAGYILLSYSHGVNIPSFDLICTWEPDPKFVLWGCCVWLLVERSYIRHIVAKRVQLMSSLDFFIRFSLCFIVVAMICTINLFR